MLLQPNCNLRPILTFFYYDTPPHINFSSTSNISYSMWKCVLSLFIIAPAIAFASSPQYIALADSADNYMKRERWDAAEKTIIKALRLEPANFSNSLLFSNLGVAQTNLGKYDDALESFRLGLSIAPNSSTLHNNRARTLLYKGRKEEAFEDIIKSLEIDSIQEWPLQMKGLLLLEKDKLDEAKEIFLSLSHNFPYNDVAIAALGKIAEKEGDNETALKYYDEALRLADDPETRSWRILLKISMDRYSDASADIREGIEKYPENPFFYVWRGYLHRLNYRREEANADKKIAISKGADPQFVDLYIPSK